MHLQRLVPTQARHSFSPGKLLRIVFAFTAIAIPTVFSATTNAATLPTSGFHQIINKNSNKCVDVAGVSTANGAAIHLWDCLQNQQNQQWQFVATDSGFYRLVARHSNKVLDVSGISTSNGAQLHQWDWVGGQNQQWQAVDVGGGYYKFVARHSGRVIDVPNCGTANGTQLQQWDDLNNACQAFRIVAVAGGTTTDTPPAGFNTRCAAENQTCSFSGTANVVYGAGNTWSAPKQASGGIACNNATFGDPTPNIAKSCYMASVTTTTTTTTTSTTCQSATNPSHVVSGRRTEFTQSWCDTVCVTYIGNNTACLNKDGILVSNASICSDAANAKEAMLDIEFNLGINIDDQFQAMAGYQGAVPALNPGMTAGDVRKYFVALLGEAKGTDLTNRLNTNGDGWIDRNEASQAKGADPLQVLGTGFGCGLSTDDIMAYIGLYMGDGAIDKYAGDLDASVKASMLKFTRSWQPGVNAQACEYRGGCGGTVIVPASSQAASSRPATTSTTPSSVPSSNCPTSHPYFSTQCARCFTDITQAISASCN